MPNKNEPLIKGKIPSPYAALLLRTPTHTILVDTGGTSTKTKPSHLMEALAVKGVKPEQVDTVIITHAHLDHIGGTLGDDGNPAFPNAKWVLFKQECDFWTQEKPDLSAVNIDDPCRASSTSPTLNSSHSKTESN
ncbi:MAG: MBL fold metallo-hydrolase [Nibricoccus sp.]